MQVQDDLLFTDKRTLFARNVERLNEHALALWGNCDASINQWGPTFSAGEQRAREKELEKFLSAVTGEFDQPLRNEKQNTAARNRILEAYGLFLKAGLDFEDRHIDIVLGNGVTDSASDFVHAAKYFDDHISGEDVYQASRNVFAMNSLQILLGLPVRLTSAMFAYSMLYPYSDNYLDDPSIADKEKRLFNVHFAQRLRGENVEPQNKHERKIFDLISLIERQFERSYLPQVFESLLAIHRAQEKSLRLLQKSNPPGESDVEWISFEKGGASVLADGYLVAGDLDPAQEEFMFGHGAFLQLVDDLQDVREDRENGLRTVFSQAAPNVPLDELTARTINFGFAVLNGLSDFNGRKTQPLKELFFRSTVLLNVFSAGREPDYFSKTFYRELERYSPFRFSFLRKCKKKLSQKHLSFIKLITTFTNTGSSTRPLIFS